MFGVRSEALLISEEPLGDVSGVALWAMLGITNLYLEILIF